MDRSPDERISDLTAQVAELRAINAELGRTLAAADSGTPLRSSLTAALTLSRVEDAVQAAAAARSQCETALTERDAAIAERDTARASVAAASAELERLRAMLSRRSVRTAQLAARMATPVFDGARRLRGRAAASRTSDPVS